MKRRPPQRAGPNLSSATASGRKTTDASKVKNSMKVKFQKDVKKEEEDDEDEEDEDGGDDEEQAVSVTEMFSSQFGKEENDYDDYDSG